MNNFNLHLDGTNVLSESVLNGIDTSNLISTLTGQINYTPSNDCYLVCRVGINVSLYIDDVEVLITVGTGGNARPTFVLPIKKGQTIKTNTSQTELVKIYGVKR